MSDTYDAWTEGAYAYIRDELRANATVGINKTVGFQAVEVGTPDLMWIASHPESMPVLWVEPGQDVVRRSGEVITHEIGVTFHVYSVGPLGSVGEYSDAQKAHRQRAGKVYNEAFALYAGGQAAGHWCDWEPIGPIQPEAATIGGGRAAFHSMIPFRLTMDRFWNQGV